MDYLTELYEDGMRCYVGRRRDTEKYRELDGLRKEADGELRPMLAQKELDLLCYLLEMQAEMNQISNATAFREGFRLCAGLIRELYPITVSDTGIARDGAGEPA